MYGNISYQKLNEQRQKPINHTYVRSDPITNIFSVINQYYAMSKANGTPETPKQPISIGKIIITNANIFVGSAKKCNAKSAINQTWTNFKAQFTEAQPN